jgi:hypothetical protein
MNDTQPAACPHCGSNQLIAHQSSRRVFINHEGERIPLLTVNFRLDHPVMEENAVTYTCSCSWNGNGSECRCEL